MQEADRVQSQQLLRFYIEKTAENGLLQLTTNLGFGVAEVRWDASSLFVTANGKTQIYKNFAALTEELLGIPIELDDWLSWLNGTADETQHDNYHYKKQSETAQSLHFLVYSDDGRIKINALIQK